jgi:crotonobetainyl-CoA:carnitine CoA-transferase CaiB-like acyl-CoA transferase
MIAAYHEQRWRAFCHLLGLEQLLEDRRFSTLSNRVQYRNNLFDIVKVPLKTRTTAEWLVEFEAVDIICAPVANYADVTQSSQFVESASMVRFTHAVAGDIDVIGPMRTCISEEDQPMREVQAPPRLGEHTREVLAQLATEKLDGGRERVIPGE